MVTRGNRGLQGVKGGYRGLQRVTGFTSCNKWLQEVTGGCKGLKVVRGG